MKVGKQPSSAGICTTCGKWVDKRYGGEGRYLPECIACWLKYIESDGLHA